MTDRRLEGKTAIVSGAGRGIGRAIAARFLAGGARALLIDIDRAALADAADELGAGAHPRHAARGADARRVAAHARRRPHRRVPSTAA